jgi:hypothetical protein
MNFHELLAKMQQLDQPASTVEQITDEMGCGSPMPPANDPPVAPPSMSINLNAQGMENIEDLMKLVTKVNPDMDKPPMPPLPSLSPEPSIMSIKPSLPPLKMLPDFDLDNDDKPGGEMDTDYDKDGKLDPHEKDHADEKPLLKSLDKDGDGDHDMDDHGIDKKGEKEAYGNSPMGASEPEYKGMDAAVPNGNDLNRPKKSFSGKPYRGDNPMAAGAYESTDLRAQIRADLQRRLNEAKKS